MRALAAGLWLSTWAAGCCLDFAPSRFTCDGGGTDDCSSLDSYSCFAGNAIGDGGGFCLSGSCLTPGTQCGATTECCVGMECKDAGFEYACCIENGAQFDGTVGDCCSGNTNSEGLCASLD